MDRRHAGGRNIKYNAGKWKKYADGHPKLTEEEKAQLVDAISRESGREDGRPEEPVSYETFVEELISAVHEKLGYPEDMVEFLEKGYSSDNLQTIKLIRDMNRTYKGKDGDRLLVDMLLIKTEYAPNMVKIQRVSTRGLYDFYLKQGFNRTLTQIPGYDAAAPDAGRILARAMKSYEKIADMLIVRPLNYDKNAAVLKSCVYRRVGDVALVLYQLLSDDEKNILTSKISKSELTRWGKAGEEEDVFAAALRNTARLFPACIYSKKKAAPVDFLKEEVTKNDSSFGTHILLSTFKTTNGAAALFYPGVREKMLKVMGGPFCAVFMNENDVMIFDRDDPMSRMYAETAGRDSTLGHAISDKCYVCDEKGISVAGADI